MSVLARIFAICFIALVWIPDLSQAESECTPACRTGYICLDGVCISECNPSCPEGQFCLSGDCVPKTAPAKPAKEPAGATAKDSSWNVGGKAGLLFPGTISMGGVEGDTELGFMLGSYIDTLVAPKLSIGGYFDFYYTTAEYSGDSAIVLSMGGTIKGRFQIADVFELRPGLAVGYNYTSWEGSDDSANGFNIAAKAEAAIPFSNNLNILIELSFISQPAGGTGDEDISWAPIIFIAAGIEFAG